MVQVKKNFDTFNVNNSALTIVGQARFRVLLGTLKALDQGFFWVHWLLNKSTHEANDRFGIGLVDMG